MPVCHCDSTNKPLEAHEVYAISMSGGLPTDPSPDASAEAKVHRLLCLDEFMLLFEAHGNKATPIAIKASQLIAIKHLKSTGRLSASMPTEICGPVPSKARATKASSPANEADAKQSIFYRYLTAEIHYKSTRKLKTGDVCETFTARTKEAAKSFLGRVPHKIGDTGTCIIVKTPEEEYIEGVGIRIRTVTVNCSDCGRENRCNELEADEAKCSKCSAELKNLLKKHFDKSQCMYCGSWSRACYQGEPCPKCGKKIPYPSDDIGVRVHNVLRNFSSRSLRLLDFTDTDRFEIVEEANSPLAGVADDVKRRLLQLPLSILATTNEVGTAARRELLQRKQYNDTKHREGDALQGTEAIAAYAHITTKWDVTAAMKSAIEWSNLGLYERARKRLASVKEIDPNEKRLGLLIRAVAEASGARRRYWWSPTKAITSDAWWGGLIIDKMKIFHAHR